jgi:glycosyltransferase involved in cell wall biosynthesis
MAMAKAVVSTRIGAEGLPFRNGREIFLEDDPKKFARIVIELLQNEGQRATLEKAARARVVREHDWESVVDELEEILTHVRRDSGTSTSVISSARLAVLREP